MALQALPIRRPYHIGFRAHYQERPELLLSLYSGCGGLDLGFERAGFSIGLAYDISASAIASWTRNRPAKNRGHVADLSSIRLRDIDRDFGEKFIPTGVIGGPPCQSFSRANHFRSTDDERSNMVRRFFSIALRFHRHRRPLDFILMENVPELSTTDSGNLLQRELERLSCYNFDTLRFCLNAVDHSVPQYRLRLFILAIPKQDEPTRWAVPIGEKTTKTVQDAILGLPSPLRFRRGIAPTEVPFHPNHWCMNLNHGGFSTVRFTRDILRGVASRPSLGMNRASQYPMGIGKSMFILTARGA